MAYLWLTWMLAPLVMLRLALSRNVQVPQNILLIQTAKIGDYICTTPLIRVLRQAYPEARISLLVNPLVEPLARYQPGVDGIFALASSQLRGFSGRWTLYRLMRDEDFDTTICMSPNLAFLLIPFLAGVRRRASILPNFGGCSYRMAMPFLSVAETHRQGRMTVETGMALLQLLGINVSLPPKEIASAPGADERVDMAFPELRGKLWLGLGVSSGNKLKELGRDKLSSMIQQLLNISPLSGVVLIGSSDDKKLATELCADIGSPRVIDTTGCIKLEDLAALIDRLGLYVGVDSGITYLADARGIPVVDIMGPADPEDQRPTGHHAVVLHSNIPCAPCSHAFRAPYTCIIGTRACVQATQLETVLVTITQLLKRIDAMEL